MLQKPVTRPFHGAAGAGSSTSSGYLRKSRTIAAIPPKWAEGPVLDQLAAMPSRRERVYSAADIDNRAS
jgi:hypothetical protein